MSTLGTTLVILLVLFFAFAAAVIIYSRDMTGEQVAQTVAEGGETKSIYFAEKYYYLSEGMSLRLEPVTVPAVITSGVEWNTGDASVVSVDSSGVMTAVGRGRTVVSVYSNGLAANAEVIVTDDIADVAASAVRRLASDACAYEDVCSFAGKFDEGSDMDVIIKAVTGDSMDETVYTEAAAKRGIDRTEALTAMLAGRCKRAQSLHAATLSFTGDVTLGRFNENGSEGRFPAVYESSGSYTYPFDRVKALFGCDDLTTVNFEGTITNSVIHKPKTFYFRGDPSYAGILTSSWIECAGLENNHSGDYYALGLKETKRFLTGAGVSVFDADEPLTVTVSTPSGAGNIVMLSYMWASGDAPAQSSLDSIYSKIEQNRANGNIIVVNCHWGREGAYVPAAWQQAAAHRMIDLGADIVIGHHPHALQGIECYNGRYIAYSLGNFAFGGNSKVSNPESMILRAYIDAGDGGFCISAIEAVPCLTTSSGSSVNDYRPMLCFGSEGERVRGVINDRSAQLRYGFAV